MKILPNKAFSLIELSIVILIIGILIAGVTQGSKLIDKAKLSNARTLTQSSPVAGIKDLAVWWESTSEKSFAEVEAVDGEEVTSWYDINPQTTNQKILTQTDSAKKPTYVAKAINGLPALHFDGSNDFLSAAYSSDLNSPDFTIFVVLNVRGYHINGFDSFKIFSSTDDNGYSGTFISYDDPGVNGGAGFTINGGDDANLDYIEEGFAINEKHFILEADYKQKTSTLNLYLNGTVPSSPSPAGRNFVPSSSHMELSPNTSASFLMGKGSGSNSEFTGNIAEFILFNRALKTDERDAVNEYLHQKWGIE